MKKLILLLILATTPALAGEICKVLPQKKSENYNDKPIVSLIDQEVCLKYRESRNNSDAILIESISFDGQNTPVVSNSAFFKSICESFYYLDARLKMSDSIYSDEYLTPQSLNIEEAVRSHQFWIQTSKKTFGFGKNNYKKIEAFYCVN